MRPRKRKLNEAQQRWVISWWRALQPRGPEDAALPGELSGMGRGERAQLRRCRTADELLAQPSVLMLANRLVSLNGEKGFLPDQASSYEHIAWVAGALALVKENVDDDKTLAWRLGYGAGNDRIKMSELRFKALQRSTTPDDSFNQFCRAVQLAGCKADVACLADDLLSWLDEQGRTTGNASSSVKFHWAYDYYLSNKDRNAAEEPEFNKEINK